MKRPTSRRPCPSALPLTVLVLLSPLAACGSGDDNHANQNSLFDGSAGTQIGPAIDGGGGNGGGGEAGSGGFEIDGGGGSGSNGEGGLGASGCASTSKKAETVPLDMVFGIDTSFSMDFDDKWTNVKGALQSFVTNPAYSELGIGLQLFPIRKQCSVADYQALAVDLALEGTVAGPIVQTLDQQQMAGGTPMVPLLEGLVAYLRAHPNPARKPIIVLATDGVPDDTCTSDVGGETPNTLENAVAVAAAAYAGTPSIATFVIGVGAELSALNGIAQAGGTGAATLVDTGGQARQQFLAALDAARRTAIPCDFAIPSGTGNDPDATNVTYSPAAGATETFVFVGDAASCARAPGNGWYFDDLNQPTKVILCPVACDAVKSDDQGQVNVVFGCPRVDVH